MSSFLSFGSDLVEGQADLGGAGIVITGSVVTAGAARTLFGKEPQ